MPMILPQVEATAVPLQQFEAPRSENVAAEQGVQQGQAMMKAGSALTKIAQDLQDEVDTAAAKEADNRLADTIRASLYDPERGYMATAGKTSLTARTGVVQNLDEAIRQGEDGLATDAQKYMFRRAATARRQSALQLVDGHAMQQAKVYNIGEAKARMDGARLDGVANWAGWSDAGGIFARSKQLLLDEAATVAQLSGIPQDSAQYRQFLQGATTQFHKDVLDTMISGGFTKDAREYLSQAKKNNEILPDRYDELNKHVKIAATATEADNLAEDVFGKWAQGKGANAAIPLYDLEAEARKRAGDNEDLQKSAIAGIKERAASWNGQQAEYKAQNISGVWRQIDAGKSLRQIQTSQEWLGLSDTERHQVKKQMEEEAAVRANRAAAQSQKELAELQRQEHLNFLKNGDAYLTATDPTVLKNMTRAQVEAKRSIFGMTATQHLLDKWDSLRDPKKYGEAKMDADDFNAVATGLNLNPYSTNKGERAKVGALRFHVEQAIDLEQQGRKAPMTRQEKLEFIRKEMGKTVMLDTWGPFNQKKPALALTPADREKLMVPKEERAKIVTSLQTMYKQHPNNPLYAPTEANVRRLYLKAIAPGAATDYQELE